MPGGGGTLDDEKRDTGANDEEHTDDHQTQNHGCAVGGFLRFLASRFVDGSFFYSGVPIQSLLTRM